MSVGIYTDENGYVKAAGAAKEGTATNTTYDNNKSKIQANNVQSAIDEIAEGGLGKEMTKEQYNALPEEKKMDGSQYFIKDEDLFIPQMVDMRKATYDALPESEKKNGNTYFITDEHSEPSAENIDYVGDISANNVKDALDTLNSTIGTISSSIATSDVTNQIQGVALWSGVFGKVYKTGKVVNVMLSLQTGLNPAPSLQVFAKNLPKPIYPINSICWVTTADGVSVKYSPFTIDIDGNLIVNDSINFQNIIRVCVGYVTND